MAVNASIMCFFMFRIICSSASSPCVNSNLLGVWQTDISVPVSVRCSTTLVLPLRCCHPELHLGKILTYSLCSGDRAPGLIFFQLRRRLFGRCLDGFSLPNNRRHWWTIFLVPNNLGFRVPPFDCVLVQLCLRLTLLEPPHLHAHGVLLHFHPQRDVFQTKFLTKLCCIILSENYNILYVNHQHVPLEGVQLPMRNEIYPIRFNLPCCW